jgi:hypothetical protein
VWITPSVAQAIVSSTVEQGKLDSEEADRRYAWLRQDFHLLIVRFYGTDYMLMKNQAKFFLLTGKTAVPGEVVKAPFTIVLLGGEGPRMPKYLVRFPRLNLRGENTISSAASKVEVVIQFPQHQAVVPVSVKKLIKAGAEL